ncbi:DUF6385 domain-containing protein [Paenibacillus contaminans]|uniref:DUF6385 domain-containing protein n=1 Tax=Paenibacillus contaminans TaxID=450362 RepID=A0A329MSN3_9BACL|nr:DUF6385 domain-containing protein [Paenibacillus contaminans]RAV22804.1 hypothetical protein DQG23_00910 [Paenibacillus contaminans]
MKASGKSSLFPVQECCSTLKKLCRPKRPGKKNSCKKKDKKNRRQTGSCGRFVEQIFPSVIADGNWHCLPMQNTSNMSVYTYAVINKSGAPVEAKVEVSPNAVDFAKDVQDVVAGGGKNVIVPLRFLKYTRLCVKAKNPSDTAKVQVYYQGQLR